MAYITHSCSCKQWLTGLPICLKRYIRDYENSTYPRKSLESEWGLCLSTAFAKIIQGIWVWLRLALFYHNTMKRKKKPSSSCGLVLHKAITNSLIWKFWLTPLLVDELERIQCMVDLVKEMRQDIFHSSWTFASYRVANMLDGSFFSIRVEGFSYWILPLPRSLCSYEDMWGEWWLDKVCQQYVTPQCGACGAVRP